MSSINMKDWIDITDFKECDFKWALRNYECPQYMFAEEYKRDEIRARILKSHRIKDTIEKRKRETGISNTQSLQEASKIIDEIAHTFSIRTIRFMAYMLIKIFKQLFQRVLVNKTGIEKFKECTKHTPIVLVPTHSSYFDFLIASAICFALDLPLPAIVSGQDFLHIAVVNHLLRGSGAFYMRRSFASDTFYRNIFTEYVQQILSIGDRPIEFFPEGTRSRSGKALQPKLGLLSMVLESCFHGFVQDVCFIPMSVSYEKITEEMLYTYELVGIPKPKESLSGLLKARSVLTTDYGTVCVTLGEPMYLREYCSGKINGMDYVRIPRCERHLKIFGREADEMKIAKYFGEKLIFTQQQNLIMYPRPVVTYLMMNRPEANVDSLCYKIDKIVKMLKKFGYRTFGFEEILLNKHAVTQAVKFSDMVLSSPTTDKITSTIAAFTDPKSVQSTSLYEAFGRDGALVSTALSYIYSSCQRNKLIHGCLLPAMLLHCVKVNNHVVECHQQFSFLKNLFRIEFIFDPESTDGQNFLLAQEKLSSQNLITCVEDNVRLNERMEDELEFLLGLLQPFLDAYMIILICYLHNSYEFPSSLKEMTQVLQLDAAKFINSVQMQTYEALCLQTLSNIVTSFCKNGQLKTVKNEKFETLISGIDEIKMTEMKVRLANFVSPEISHRLSRSKL